MQNTHDNPLLIDSQFPDFAAITPAHALPAIKALCQSSKAEIEALTQTENPTWQDYEQLESIHDRLNKAFTPISHLFAVTSTEAWREAYTDSQAVMTQYNAEMSQHQGLYQFYLRLRDADDFAKLSKAQQKLVHDAIFNFELSGVGLPEADKVEYQKMASALSQLSTSFSNNVLDATESFVLHLDENEADCLKGVPETALALYRQNAKDNGHDGFDITLDFPSYLPILTYAEDADLRKTLYDAYITRASDQGPDAGMFDNTETIAAILSLRHDLANLLGFTHYSDLSLADKMAKQPERVLTFLNDLVAKTKPKGEAEFAALQDFAKKTLNLDKLNPWDIAYVSEKLKEKEYALSDEMLRLYFPVDKVLTGLFALTKQLFGVEFAPNHEISTWHPDVLTYTVLEEGVPIAYFYLDLYARKGKRGGAWMNNAVDKMHSSNKQQLPVAYLVCNFMPPTDGKPAYLSHDEISTLFHEFGHGLHHMLSKIPYVAQSGINGVEWDAVELPSQFMENFCYDFEVLQSMSAHQQTGEPLPQAIFTQLLRAKNFHSALMMLRQLEFSLFDMAIHHQDKEDTRDVLTVLDDVRQAVAVTPSVDYARFPMAFSHIFAGGYAAGYYSYKWAEVLSADAFSRFEEEGVKNPSTGRAFRDEILARGSSRTALENFVAFRGREPDVNALLRHLAIID